MSSQTRIKALITAACLGSTSETKELEEIFLSHSGRNVSLFQVFPVVKRHLSELILETIDHTSPEYAHSPNVQNALSAMNMLGHGFFYRNHFVQVDPRLWQSLDGFCDLISQWALVLLHGTNILADKPVVHTFLFGHIEKVFYALSRHLPYRANFTASGNLLGLLLDSWTGLCRQGHPSAHNIAHSLIDYLVPETKEAMENQEENTKLYGLRLCLNLGCPATLAEASVQWLVTEITKEKVSLMDLKTTLLMAMYCNMAHYPVRAWLIGKNAVVWMSYVARRLTSRRVQFTDNKPLQLGICLCVAFEQLQIYLRAGHRAARSVIECHVLESIILAEPVLHGPFNFNNASESAALRKAMLTVLDKLFPFMIYRSVLGQLKKALNRLWKRNLIARLPPGEFLDGFHKLEMVVALQIKENAEYDKHNQKGLLLCTNLCCPRRTISESIQELVKSTSAETVIRSRICSGCKSATYCSESCQREAWIDGEHKRKCHEIKSCLESGEALPAGARDLDLIYDKVERDLLRHQDEIPGLVSEYLGDTESEVYVIQLDYRRYPDDVRITVTSLEECRKVFTPDEEKWRSALERASSKANDYVFIVLPYPLSQLTNLHLIKQRVYAIGI